MKVVSNTCKTSLQSLSLMLPRYSLRTNLVPCAYFCLKLKCKKVQRQGCLTTGKERFTVFCYRKLKWKKSKCQLFYLPTHWPASFLPTVNDANQKIM